jgi:hypothetical protein
VVPRIVLVVVSVNVTVPLASGAAEFTVAVRFSCTGIVELKADASVTAVGAGVMVKIPAT